MRRLLPASVLLLATLLGVPATARSDPPPKSQVRALLSAYESVPGARTWERLGPDTLRVLIALYQDPSHPPYIRLRAVSVARHYPTDASRAFLRAVARAPEQSELFVRAAVIALGRGFGEEAMHDVRRYLKHPSEIVREAAARSLGRMDTASAREALQRHLRVERSETVRRTLRQALRPRP